MELLSFFLKSTKTALPVILEYKALASTFGLSVVVGQGVGLLPKLGPIRAIVLGFKSRFRRVTHKSLRKNELQVLHEFANKPVESSYVVVLGNDFLRIEYLLTSRSQGNREVMLSRNIWSEAFWCSIYISGFESFKR
jgi:hypothetical protein